MSDPLILTGEVRLFVYGSLKRGFPNERELAMAVFERRVATARGHALYDLGAYPALVREGYGVVHGELYRVPRAALRRLDEFEGCPDLYQVDEIVLEDGTRARAYSMSSVAVRGHPRIEAGSWERRGDGAGSP
jgi:gamma-glutamylcyclotransferase (GGCT)/AIG2-like uncharacterized protein YtfP